MSFIISKAVFSAIIAASFGLLFNIRGKNILFAGLNGGAGYFVFLSVSSINGTLAMFLSSMVMAVFAEIAARRLKSPATMFLVPGLIPIVPGGVVFSFMLELLRGNQSEAMTLFLKALMDTGAIAAGIVSITSLVKLAPHIGIPINPNKKTKGGR